jgi:hypothetical protein
MKLSLFQICYKNEHFKNFPNGMIAWDNTANLNPKLCEFPIFNEAYQHAIDLGLDYWGLMSPKFEKKSFMAASKFKNWIESELQVEKPANVFFVNPAPINESLSLNAITQGEICHPGMAALIQHALTGMGINFDALRVVVDDDTFAMCNYFVGDRIFWKLYLDFVNTFLAEVEKNSDDKNMMYEISAQYGPDHSIPYYTFVVERLFSLFLILYRGRITSQHYTYSKEEMLSKTQLPSLVIEELNSLSLLKKKAIQHNESKLMDSWSIFRTSLIMRYPNIFNIE